VCRQLSAHPIYSPNEQDINVSVAASIENWPNYRLLNNTKNFFSLFIFEVYQKAGMCYEVGKSGDGSIADMTSMSWGTKEGHE